MTDELSRHCMRGKERGNLLLFQKVSSVKSFRSFKQPWEMRAFLFLRQPMFETACVRTAGSWEQ